MDLVDILSPVVDGSSLHDPLQNDSEINLLQSSTYMDYDSLVQSVVSTKNPFPILSINVMSLNARIDSIKSLLCQLTAKKCHIAAIIIQETWLPEGSDVSLIQIPNYNFIWQPSKISAHGGLAIYLLEDYHYKLIPSFSSYVCENLFVEVCLEDSKNILLGNIYRTPCHKEFSNSKSKQKFIEDISPMLSKLAKKNKNIVICGDFNLDLLRCNEDVSIANFIDAMFAQGFIPKITLPTRYDAHHLTSSLIDNIFFRTTLSIPTSSGILVSRIADHLACFLCLDLPKNSKEIKPPRYIAIPDNCPKNIEKFCNKIAEQNFTDELDQSEVANPNTNYGTFSDKIEEIRNETLKSKTVKFNRRKHSISKWITDGIINSINTRDGIYKQWMNSILGTDECKELKGKLDKYNKHVDKTIRIAKKAHFDKIFSDCKNDIKRTWKEINNLLNRVKANDSFPSTFIIDDCEVSDIRVIADKFNDFFLNIGLTMANSVPPPSDTNLVFSKFLSGVNEVLFEFSPISEDDVLKYIDSLSTKSSYGYDHISTKLLKSIKTSVAAPLALIINQSFRTGIYPDLLKIAKVVPIPKKINSPSLIDYRPISILPSMSKVFERAIHIQLSDYLKQNNLLNSNQYGFRSEHSTELASIELVDRVLKIMDTDDTPFSLFLDLSKAFDSLDHFILLQKLKFYGIHSLALNLFESYLTNREQYVIIKNTTSSRQKITTGVPQGSILGPLLFLIYVNDLPLAATTSFNVLSYADDTTLTGSLRKFKNKSESKDISSFINQELTKISDWLSVNKLSLNVAKTKFMIYQKPGKTIIDKLSLKFNDTDIEQVKSFKFLGLTMDQDMSWKTHISQVTSKLRQTVGILSKLKHFIPKTTLMTIYNSLFLPRIHYCLLTWGFAPHKQITTLQRKAVRIINNANYNADAEPLLKQLKTLTVDDIFLQKVFIFYFLHSLGKLPIYQKSFRKPEPPHEHSTRFGSIRNVELKKDYTRNCIRYIIFELENYVSGPSSINLIDQPYAKSLRHSKFINNLNKPKHILKSIMEKVHTHSMCGFKFYIKSRLIELYSSQ